MRPPSLAVTSRLLPACAVVAVLALAGCGGSDSAIPGKQEDSTTTAAASATDPEGPSENAAGGDGATGKRKAPGNPCRAQLGDFLGSLDRLRVRLAAGLSYQQYTAAVKKTRGAYAGLDANRLPPDCLVAAGTAAEKSFNRYIEAANTWGECLADAGCDGRAVEPELQREWQVASHWLSQAHAGLKRLS